MEFLNLIALTIGYGVLVAIGSVAVVVLWSAVAETVKYFFRNQK